jgi:hypothetical protein
MYIGGKERKLKHLDPIQVHIAFKEELVKSFDTLYGKDYTTKIYKKAFDMGKPLVQHMFKILHGQQWPHFRSTYDRAKATYGRTSHALNALANWPTGDQQLRWALAPSSGVWPPETSSCLRQALERLDQMPQQQMHWQTSQTSKTSQKL